MTAKWPSWAPNTEYYALSFAGILTSVFPSSYFCRAYKYFNGQVYIPIIERAVPNTTEKYPLVVFSHGLGCTRSSYSRICYEIASHGFMVVAVEHRYELSLKLVKIFGVLCNRIHNHNIFQKFTKEHFNVVP